MRSKNLPGVRSGPTRPERSALPADLLGLDTARVMLAFAPGVLAAAWSTATARPGTALAIAALGWAVLSATVLTGVASRHPHARFGLANLVTTLRAAIAVVLLVTLLQANQGPLIGWVLVAVVVAMLVLDGIDGAAARATGLASDFGARYDMEVDAASALILSFLIWKTQGYGMWILALGLPRYAFLLAGRLDASLRADLYPSQARKLICVQQMATLCLLCVPGLPIPVGSPLAAAALATLGWSFGRDILWLKRADARLQA